MVDLLSEASYSYWRLWLLEARLQPKQCGGENLSNVEVESVLYSNPVVNEAAVVARPDDEQFDSNSEFRSQIQAYVFDIIIASVSKLNLDDAFEQKNEIAKAMEEELKKVMSAYGYEIVQTLIVDIDPDENVKRAMNEINVGARLRVAANEKVEAKKIV
ncbi:hypothetical protein K1719_023983 [Acacia pycnantha]|nr:hypothetical protein K1719_023983 [Acacia pycnantha]